MYLMFAIFISLANVRIISGIRIGNIEHMSI